MDRREGAEGRLGRLESWTEDKVQVRQAEEMRESWTEDKVQKTGCGAERAGQKVRWVQKAG